MASLEIINDISKADLKTLEDGVESHAHEKGGEPLIFHDLAVLRRDADGNIEAGLYGKTFWNWLYIDSLWVHPRIRGQGVGQEILKAAEDEAIRRGCVGVYLWTQDFDAPDFYPKFGYQKFVTMEDFPHKHQRIGYMKKLVNNKP